MECNLKVINYLEVTLGLNDGSYRPYRKPNDETHYIHIHRSPTIYNQATSTVHQNTLITLPSSKDIFYERETYYEQRLTACGYNKKLTYQQQGENIENIRNIGENRKCNIIWFNQLYSKSLKTNIGKYFLDSSVNIFHQITNFRKSLIKRL